MCNFGETRKYVMRKQILRHGQIKKIFVDIFSVYIAVAYLFFEFPFLDLWYFLSSLLYKYTCKNVARISAFSFLLLLNLPHLCNNWCSSFINCLISLLILVLLDLSFFILFFGMHLSAVSRIHSLIYFCCLLTSAPLSCSSASHFIPLSSASTRLILPFV